jgi:hypothetical protein
VIHYETAEFNGHAHVQAQKSKNFYNTSQRHQPVSLRTGIFKDLHIDAPAEETSH